MAGSYTVSSISYGVQALSFTTHCDQLPSCSLVFSRSAETMEEVSLLITAKDSIRGEEANVASSVAGVEFVLVNADGAEPKETYSVKLLTTLDVDADAVARAARKRLLYM